MSAHAVIRVEPLKNSSSVEKSAKHILRLNAKNGINIDPVKSPLNQTLYGTDDIQGDVAAIVSQYTKAHSNTTECAEIVLSAKSAWFDSISPKWRDGVITPEMQAWIDDNIKFLKAYEGLASATLHLDEESPHIHALVVPVATYDISYRRGTKSVTRIAYNRVFGDDMALIIEAQQSNNSELTKLGRLQTSYGDAMKPHGLLRGVRGSNAVHVSPKEHIARINKPVPKLPKVTTVVPEPTFTDTLKERAGFTTAHSEAVTKRKLEENKRLKAGLKQIKILEARSNELHIVKQRVEQHEETLVQQDEIIEALKKKVAILDDALTLEKAIVSALRKTPLADIAERLEYSGELTWKNAIDMTKELGQLSYNEALSWLNHEFGNGVAIAASIDHAASNVVSVLKANTTRVETAPEAAKRLLIETQLDALAADNYRITLMGEADLPSYSLGKSKGIDGAELMYNKTELLTQLPLLSKENRRGYNIFITPFAKDKNYLLLDDLTQTTLNNLLTDGYTPATIIKSSPNSTQAVLVTVAQDETKPVLNSVFKELNTMYGDAKIIAQVHPFRLVGFTNRKQKHLDQDSGFYPFVSIVKCAHTICKKAMSYLKSFADITNVSKAPIKSTSQKEINALFNAPKTPNSARLKTSDFDAIVKSSSEFYRVMELRYGDKIDLSRADWMLCAKLTAAKVPHSDIVDVLYACSPYIKIRHPMTSNYVEKTTSNAQRYAP